MSSYSDSSEEDLSRFKDVVDDSFLETIGAKQDISKTQSVSERYLPKSGHYNDVSVGHDTQRIIGNKLSALIQKKIEFVNTPLKVVRHKVKGGVKLFKTSENYLTCQEVTDTETLEHNEKFKKFKRKRRRIDDCLELDENGIGKNQIIHYKWGRCTVKA
ncbi:hypothetical protein EVAR_8638_1 [Eumeta japonica]|uniref:Uncharacterized protein n=1 Tax=Eumeta variegata TaxID=151549 RepID=A0A4C1TUG8_EUMVA|nr:hypothetical protein EVAR_8638_1 [Eumeta japonica]